MSDGEIVTRRLRLRRLREDDETRVVAYRSDARASRYLNHPPMGPGEFRDWFAERSPEWNFDRPGHRRFYGIDERSSGLLIGDAVLVRSADGREGEIGMFLDPATSGLGYSLEIGQALLAAAFEGFGLHRVVRRADMRNRGSVRAMEHLGMRREGLLAASEPRGGGWADTVLYAMQKDEWRARAGAHRRE